MLVVVALAVALLAVGGVALLPRGTDPGPASAPVAVAPRDQVAAAIKTLVERVERLPGNWTAWAELGAAYIEQARITGDPTGYPRAQQALERSLAVHPDGNALAHTGLGALAAARHDFAGALHSGQTAVSIDPFKAAAYGVVGDALIELGRYDEAYQAIQRMVDLRPDSGSYARASYTYELRGDLGAARELMDAALEAAPGPADAAFALEHLATFAFDAGDLDRAKSLVDDGLNRLPQHPPLLVARARIAAARGDVAAAVADYRAVVRRLPIPGYVAELGDLLAASGDRAAAQEQYDLVRATATLFTAQGVDLDIDLALFYADNGAPDEAVKATETGYPKRPSVFGADARAWALHSAGRDAEALPLADKALSIGTKNATMFYHRGMIRLALGDKAGAAADLTEALRINPHFSFRHVPLARAALASLGQ
ncbi:tetratricopeptide repeat protein [Virgisporangium aliadipatigenens]|uniref:tetratricopeptide repeat protein n=1 Tax=Virgisporangium aliadipatigenens TaxID=741659 RepID=UPI00194399F7|nr:tetratricopeptide repeat protein [Virgisporangium aliadipatigenens]